MHFFSQSNLTSSFVLSSAIYLTGCAPIAEKPAIQSTDRPTPKVDSDVPDSVATIETTVIETTLERPAKQALEADADSPQVSRTESVVAIPTQLQEAPVRRVIQPYPDKTPHRIFEAKVGGDKSYMHHGRFLELYQGGAKLKMGRYEYGKKVGEWTFWSKEGVVRRKGSYDGDKQIGDWYKYRPDGSLEWIERYSNGLADGTWEAFAEDGETPLWTRAYQQGQRHGPWQEFYPDGSKRMIEHYASGKLHGPAKSWHGSGTLAAEGEYRRGARHGTFRKYGRQGELQSESR